MSSGHALLSPSSAARWLNCTLAPRLEASIPDSGTSQYAIEGTIAHKACEAMAKLKFKKIKKTAYNTAIKDLKTEPLWNDEMINTAELYAEHLMEKAMSFKHEPHISFEIKVDLTDYIPEGFGFCDCIMLGDDTLVITDYKHGKGVPVKAEANPQMMLYALGALKLYRPLYGDSIKKIETCIDQPRLGSYEIWHCTAEELLAWGESIKPIAQKAYMGFGEYKAGAWCRFCRANGQCKAQAEQRISAVEDFARNPDLLTPDEISTVLKKGKELTAWYKAVEEYALELLLKGESIPDYKVVEGRSVRAWSDQDKALDALIEAGYDRAVLYDYVPKSLAQLEKAIGAAKFAEVVGQFIVKPQGKPALAEASDSRKAFNSAALDFANLN